MDVSIVVVAVSAARTVDGVIADSNGCFILYKEVTALSL